MKDRAGRPDPHFKAIVLGLILVLGTTGCSSTGRKDMETVHYVDLERFMGDWYVLAVIPTFVERDAYNPVESYKLNANGTIDTTFRFKKGLAGAPRELKATGFVRDTDSNAVWGMQFVWPFKADYRIVYLDSDYQHTVIARQQRDYVWIMGREPAVNPEKLEAMIDFAVGLGYEESKIVITNWQDTYKEAM
jgi:apolipoprotein D and lipocalin family protein